MKNTCPICRKEVDIHHTPAIDKITGLRAHDYCLRIETPQHCSLRKAKYNQASELDADEWDAQFNREGHPACELIEQPQYGRQGRK